MDKRILKIIFLRNVSIEEALSIDPKFGFQMVWPNWNCIFYIFRKQNHIQQSRKHSLESEYENLTAELHEEKTGMQLMWLYMKLSQIL